MTAQKEKDLLKLLNDILETKGMIAIADVQRAAGLLSWMSGIFRYIKPFNTCLWGAITEHARSLENRPAAQTAKKRPTHLIFVLQIAQAVRWVHTLVTGQLKTENGKELRLRKWFSTSCRQPEQQVAIRSDASPFGFGAVLFQNGTPITWMAAPWSESDHDFLQALPGDPAWQAEWELLAVLIAIDAWILQLQGRAAAIIQTDATAALFNVRHLSGRTAAMNALTAEIALRLEAYDVQVLPEHMPAVLNFECDSLSRLAQGASISSRLSQLPRAWPRPRPASFFWAWPQSAGKRQRDAAAPPEECGRGG